MSQQAAPPPSALQSKICTPPPEEAPSLPPTSASAGKHQATPAKDAIAGACAGAIAKTVVAPIERVKLLMQLQFSIGKENGPPSSSVERRQGAWDVTKSVYRDQGVLAFWRGNTPNVIRQGGTSAMNFLLMDRYKSAISPLLTWSLKLPSNRDPQKRQKRRAVLSSFLSGGLAGGTVTTVLYPVEFVRTRLAMDVGKGTADAPRMYGGMKDVCLSIWKADGWRGMYQGYGIALAGVVLYRALHLGGYDAVKTELLHRRGHQVSLEDFRIMRRRQTEANARNDVHAGGRSEGTKSTKLQDLTMGERFLAAQIVSLVAGTACYPIDSVRRRLMMQAGVPKEERLYKNSIDCFRRVLETEGARGFYLGLGPNIVRSFGAALLLVTYDVFKIKI